MQIWAVKGDVLEYGVNGADCDWVLTPHILFECKSKESALDILNNIENGIIDVGDVVNLQVEYLGVNNNEDSSNNDSGITNAFYSSTSNLF